MSSKYDTSNLMQALYLMVEELDNSHCYGNADTTVGVFIERAWNSRIKALDGVDLRKCNKAQERTLGTYYCTRDNGHEGPCAAVLGEEYE